MKKGWMIRAGRGGRFFEVFEAGGFAAIGWNALGCLDQYQDAESLKRTFINIYGNEKPGKTANAIAMVRKFKFDIKKDDFIISYSPKRKEYLVGQDLGEYSYKLQADEHYAQIRRVRWLGKISRDQFSKGSKASLSSVLTLFALKNETIEELQDLLEK